MSESFRREPRQSVDCCDAHDEGEEMQRSVKVLRRLADDDLLGPYGSFACIPAWGSCAARYRMMLVGLL
jgi:hypothetical protein